MDDVLKIVVTGTTRAGVRKASPTAPIDRAIAQLGSLSTERSLLLTAGAYAVRRRAGVLPLVNSDVSDVANVETRRVAPERAALLLGELLSGQSFGLLVKALERLHDAQLLIPPALLSIALDVGTRHRTLRPALMVVIGQRGRWLSRRNNAWSWAATPEDDELVARADTIWKEGKHAERLDILRLLRSRDPARARELLASTWEHERAAFRAEAIELLRVGLSVNDQPFLDAALEDRATAVREHAEVLSVHIRGSRPARAAESRAERLIGSRLGVKIVIHAPDDSDVSPGVDPAAAMIQAFSRVPPSHWVIHLGKRPSDLVKAVARDRNWGFAVLAGWTQAATTFVDEEWADALWPVWLAAPPPSFGMARNVYAGSFNEIVNQHLLGLLEVMRPANAERALASALDGSFDSFRTIAVLTSLTRPWSAYFANEYLRSLRNLGETALKQKEVNWRALDSWTASFSIAALEVPDVSIQSAIALLNELHDSDPAIGTDDHWERWKKLLRQHRETLQMRQRINEEIRQ